MTIARCLLVDRENRGVYHCVSRCVRRAFLCGGEFGHRKDWIRDRLQELSGIFAIDVGAYAVMSNHLHVVIRTDPQVVQGWSPLEVAGRWTRLFPGNVVRWAKRHRVCGAGARSDDEHLSEPSVIVAALAADADRVEVLRRRLCDLSWFMKCLKETIARRANREDRCTGCFWEGRFRSYALLDDAAVLSCMVYVDLNVIRAAQARTPETSDHTSVQDRIQVRHRYEKTMGRRRRAPKRAVRLISTQARNRRPQHAEDGIWLAPIEHREGEERDGLLALTFDEYLRVVDSTGRAVCEDKRGTIPEEVAPILERLDIELNGWLDAMTDAKRLFGTVVGSARNRAAEAARRGTRWVVGVFDIHRSAIDAPVS